MIRVNWIAKKLVCASFVRKNITAMLIEVSIHAASVSSLILINIRTMKDFYKELASKIGSGTDGSRLWPTNRKLDKKLGIRFDLGQKFRDPKTNKLCRNVVLQLNANAENADIREAAGRNGTHSKRMTAQIPLNDDGTGLDPAVSEKIVKEEFISTLMTGI